MRGHNRVSDRAEIGTLPDCADGKPLIADDAHSGRDGLGDWNSLADLPVTGRRAASGKVIDVQRSKWGAKKSGSLHVASIRIHRPNREYATPIGRDTLFMGKPFE